MNLFRSSFSVPQSCLAVVVLAMLAVEGLAAKPAKSPVGNKVAQFKLKDFRGRPHSLSDFDDKKFVVVAFLGTECPLAKLYAPRLSQLAKAFQPRGVAFLGINANVHDSMTEIAAHARIHKITFPIMKDLGNKVADSMGAVRTPEVFVLDQDRVIKYHGRIDDQYGVGYVRENTTRDDLKVALLELLQGKPVSQPETEAVGCFIGRVRKPNTDSDVTYSNQIARILNKRCVDCHRPGEIAPFSLTHYDEVAGWAETIREVVFDQRMPPWHASPKHGKFSNDRLMTANEKALIRDWVANGAPEGDPSQLPKPPHFVSGWQLPRDPEKVIYMRDDPFKVPAEGVVRYKYFRVNPGFTEDKFVSMIEVVPGNRAVVHHILVAVRRRRDAGTKSLQGTEGSFLAAFVPGHRARVFPKGTAKHIPAGAELIFQVHYTPNGSAQEDRSKIGFVFADRKDIKNIVVTMEATQHRLLIPPMAENHKVESASAAARKDMTLLAMMPHMHLRGKSFRYEAIYPNGKSEILLDVPHYDFNWQTSYRLSTPKRIPKGTRLSCTAYFDNSKFNLANPDPSKTVRWGNQTWNEMMIGYFDVSIPISDFDANQARTRRNPRQQLTRGFLTALANSIRRLDKNNDKKISKSEVPERLMTIFKRLDLNKDGELTESEIQKAIEQAERRN